jgi:CYTH domain-containing protein
MKPTVNLEIERKYIIKMPPFDLLRCQPEHTESSILQIYLTHEAGETHRIRRRKYADKIVCTETRKIRLDTLAATEIESQISESAFDILAKSPLEGTTPIEKTRHTFLYEGRTFEIDIYPVWKNTAVMEVELPSRETEVVMPDFIEIISDVTADRQYKNFAMSMKFPKELI